MTEQGPPERIYTDAETDEPIVHPAGTFETHPTEPGRIGYTHEGASVTALEHEVKVKGIGDTDQTGAPAVLGGSEQDLSQEASSVEAELVDLSGDVFYKRSNGDIVKAKAMKAPEYSDKAYIVVYTIQGQTLSRPFEKGELEAMQVEIAKRLADGDTVISVKTDKEESDQSDSDNLITHVPGMPPYEGHLPSREVVTIPIEDYKGDLTRIKGHPSNPASQMMQAYSDHLRTGSDATANEEDSQK
ncbi:hypothetical protein RAAC3_TM7C00001G0589 [Candidatus Saccharibacteria bacterium RAAC3_TM7_1]|nr:hypothetical protein RAAC3_TM7C00001G0589 [Candidatus Saccharibacteria bacterium RAAC3_TM7_1]HCZ28416.1 hypothetical protein [Candidatus Saccharibacteria bacterium]